MAPAHGFPICELYVQLVIKAAESSHLRPEPTPGSDESLQESLKKIVFFRLTAWFSGGVNTKVSNS